MATNVLFVHYSSKLSFDCFAYTMQGSTQVIILSDALKRLILFLCTSNTEHLTKCSSFPMKETTTAMNSKHTKIDKMERYFACFVPPPISIAHTSYIAAVVVVHVFYCTVIQDRLLSIKRYSNTHNNMVRVFCWSWRMIRIKRKSQFRTIFYSALDYDSKRYRGHSTKQWVIPLCSMQSHREFHDNNKKTYIDFHGMFRFSIFFPKK